MIESIYGWMRNLAYYFIFMTAVLNLLPDDRYRKYVRSFLGMLLILVVIDPLLSLGDFKGRLEEIFQRENYRLQNEEVFQYSADFDEIRQEYIRSATETEIRIQIRQLLQNYELKEREIRVSLRGEETLQVERLEIYLDGSPKDSEKIGKLRQELAERYGMEEAQIYVG